jgi:hypothetical protein
MATQNLEFVMQSAFDPEGVNNLANAIRHIEEAIVVDYPLSAPTKAKLARRVIDVVSEGEADLERIKAIILNR